MINSPSFPFVGFSYQDRSINYDAQRSVNLYPVKSESGTSKAPTGLQGTPGLLAFTTLPASPHRGSRSCLGRAFCVAGDGFYEVFTDGSYSLLGTLNTSIGFVCMSDNGQQVIMVDGPYGYILTLDTDAFQEITSDAFYGADTVTFLDGYFVFNRPDTGIYYITALYNGFDIDALEFASAEASSDNLVGVLSIHNNCWLFGTDSIEVVFDSGDTDFPFQRIQGAFIEYGCVAAGSLGHTANTAFWLGQDDEGRGVVWMATGYQPLRISTFAVEYAIQTYGDITGATCYTYQEDGHYFYALNFISANTTWVYDINLQAWHERAYYSNGQYSRSLPQTHMFAFGKHLVGDYASGILYQQSLNIYDDNGAAKRWMRICPHINNGSLNYFTHRRLQIDMQTGTGLTTGEIQNTDPQVQISWSDDGGYTYSNTYMMSVGAIGNYAKRVISRMMGRARDRVYKLEGDSNTKVFIIAAHLDAIEGAN